MDEQQPQSLAQLFHKEKNQKKKQQDNSQLPVGQQDQGSTACQVATGTEVNRQQDNKQPDVARLKEQTLNSQIDEYLYGLVIEGIINPQFQGWYAKCIRTLGLSEVNKLVINARNGKAPQNLLSYKLKGAMNLHYKRIYESS